jgi:hypothetical protein
MLNELSQVIRTSQLTLPAFELVLLMVLLSVALLFRYSKAGILVAYLFAYRWAWPIVADLEKGAQFGYLILGATVAGLAFIGLFLDTRTQGTA